MPHLSFHRQLDIDGALFFAQSTSQFGKRNVLQLANALARYAEFLAYFLESFRFASIQTKPLEDNFLLAIIEDVEQAANFVAKILVTQKLERRLRFLVTNDFAEFGRIVVANRGIERGGSN